MLTYYDSTLQSLPFLTNDVNLSNPETWNIITNAYNDSPNLRAPYPNVALNQGNQQGMNVWVKEGIGGNGVALYDAPTHYWTGISGVNTSNQQAFQFYPNPCNSNITISFELQKASDVTITISSLVGQMAEILTNQNYTSGKHKLECSVADLMPGSYICSFRAGDNIKTVKLTVVR